jgi:hypothetical protein
MHIDIQILTYLWKKKNLGLQQWLKVVKHLESVSQWKKTVDDLRARKKKEKS